MNNQEAYRKLAGIIREHRGDKVWLAKNLIGVTPHSGQEKWLQRSVKRENFLVTGNRWGKSEITAVDHIVACLTFDGWTAEMVKKFAERNEPYLSINIAPVADQAAYVYQKMRQMLGKPHMKPFVKRYLLSPHPTIEFINGARFEARTTDKDAKALEGGNWDLISYDEAAIERKFTKIRELLQMRIFDHGGRIKYVSTPQGRNDFGMLFLSVKDDMDRDVDRGMYAQGGPTTENIFNTKDDLDKLTEGLSDKAKRQRIYGEVVDPDGLFFSLDGLTSAINPTLTEQNRIIKGDYTKIAHSEVYVDERPWIAAHPEDRYVHFWDLARKQDWTVGVTLDISGKKMVQVEFERFQGMDWSDVFVKIRKRNAKYKVSAVDDFSGGGSTSQTYIDSTGIGDVALDALRDIGAKGLTFTKQTKDEALANLQSAFDMHEIEFPEILVEFDELKFYERDDADLVQDCVMALAGAVQFGRRHPVMTSWEF